MRYACFFLPCRVQLVQLPPTFSPLDLLKVSVAQQFGVPVNAKLAATLAMVPEPQLPLLVAGMVGAQASKEQHGVWSTTQWIFWGLAIHLYFSWLDGVGGEEAEESSC